MPEGRGVTVAVDMIICKRSTKFRNFQQNLVMCRFALKN